MYVTPLPRERHRHRCRFAAVTPLSRDRLTAILKRVVIQAPRSTSPCLRSTEITARSFCNASTTGCHDVNNTTSLDRQTTRHPTAVNVRRLTCHSNPPSAALIVAIPPTIDTRDIRLARHTVNVSEPSAVSTSSKHRVQIDRVIT